MLQKYLPHGIKFNMEYRTVNYLTFICYLGLSISTLTSASNYSPLEQDCDGFKQVAVGSFEGTCVGLVNQFEGFKKPRKAVQLDEYRLLVSDLGGWSQHKGSLWLITSSLPDLKGKLEVTPLLKKLNLPHDIELDKKGRVLVGEAHQMRRLTLREGVLVNDELVLKKFPHKDSRHPLSNFLQLANGDLLINVGSKTDHCEGSMKDGYCGELNKNGLWLFSYDKKQDIYHQGVHLASGLRNSMALALHESGTVLQAENSSDIKSTNEPYEELNIIETGRFYGWPYCLNENFDQNLIENGCSQKSYQTPYLLLPPHTAPLDMMYAQSSKLPMLDGKLLMSWHGYRVVGNRLVAYDIDEKGLPLLAEQAWFYRDPIAPATQWTQHAFTAKEGMARQAQHVEVIHSWNKVEGLRPEGAPVGLTMLRDETLLIVDDKNQALLRLAPGITYHSEQHTNAYYLDNASLSEEPLIKSQLSDQNSFKMSPQTNQIDLNLAENQQLKVSLLEHCAVCHQTLSTAPETLLKTQNAWLTKEGGKTRIELALFNEVKPMPPTNSITLEQKLTLVKQLNNALRTNNLDQKKIP